MVILKFKISHIQKLAILYETRNGKMMAKYGNYYQIRFCPRTEEMNGAVLSMCLQVVQDYYRDCHFCLMGPCFNLPKPSNNNNSNNNETMEKSRNNDFDFFSEKRSDLF